jgi:hypothetical protein
VAFVIKPDSAIMYLNGVRAATANTHKALDFDVPMYIGKMKGSTTRQFKGMMDEICIFDTSLSQKQIKDLMYKTTSPEENPHLIHYYQFNNESGPVIDRGKGLTHATMKGNASRVESTSPVPYKSVTKGYWNDTTVWATGQMPPVNNWSRVKIETEVTLDTTRNIKSIKITPSGKLFIQNGDTLIITGRH